MNVAPDVSGFLTKQQIGTGAGSRIYEAIEQKTGRTVAIKHVVRNGPDDDRFLAQAETEYNVSSSFDHKSLRASYELIRIRKRLQLRELVLVMEHIDGLNLEKARPNRLRTFLILFRKVAEGLHAMHEAGFVHTDIKPTNVMLATNIAMRSRHPSNPVTLARASPPMSVTPSDVRPRTFW